MTELLPDDILVAAAQEFEDRKNLTLTGVTADKNHKWTGRSLTEVTVPKGTLIVMIERNGDTIIPGGDTVIREGDVMVVAKIGDM